MASFVEVSGSDKIEVGDKTRIVAADPASPSTPFEIRIHRKLSMDNKSPLTDLAVDSTVLTSDAGGYISLDWSPSTNLSAFSGRLFKYYPALYVDGTANAVVSDSVHDVQIFDSVEILLDDLSGSLGPAQAIPVYTEISKDSGVIPTSTFGTGSRTSFDFTWDNWNEYFSPQVYVIDDEAEDLKTYSTDYTIDFRDGKVNLTTPVYAHQEVEASYIFRYFSDTQLRGFLSRALDMMNYVAPYTGFTLANYPHYWRAAIVCGGVMMALEDLFQAPIFRERRLLFSDSDIVGTLSSYYDRVRSSFSDQFLAKKARWSLVHPRGVSGHDIIAPPRVTAQSFQSWAYLRGRGL